MAFSAAGSRLQAEFPGPISDDTQDYGTSTASMRKLRPQHSRTLDLLSTSDTHHCCPNQTMQASAW
jgi:hypothetical protein